MSISKVVEPSTMAVCLGIEINMVNRTFCIPDEKLQEIQEICFLMSLKLRSTVKFSPFWVHFCILQIVLNPLGLS